MASSVRTTATTRLTVLFPRATMNGITRTNQGTSSSSSSNNNNNNPKSKVGVVNA
jgi:hypothetical protein